jgi:hypothetical protein
MTDTQVEALLIEVLRITRGFGEALRLISEQKAEIIALQMILEDRGVACAEEMEAARAEALMQLKGMNAPDSPHGVELSTLDSESKWKM